MDEKLLNALVARSLDEETLGVGVSPATIGRFLKEEGFDRMHRRSLKRREKRLKR